MCGCWDDKDNISSIVKLIQCYFGIDYQDYAKNGCIADLLSHHLRQRRKHMSNDVNALHGLTLQKSTAKHKVPGKNYSVKRKLGVFKNEFIHWRNGNASKLQFNEWCSNNDLKDKKVDIEEVDTSKKILPNVDFL